MKKVILLLVLILLICLAYSFAAVPCKINYQGRLIKDNVPVDGQVNMEFKLYTQLTGGILKKTIFISNVPVYNGLFRAVLDLEGIDWAAGETMYLEVKVGTDVLSPREELSAYPYAINSHLLEGATKEYFLNTSTDTQKKDGGLNIMGNVGIGTTSPDPSAKLDINGSIRIRGGNPDAGKVLTTDASGNATWQTPSGSSWTALDLASTTPFDINCDYKFTTEDGAEYRATVINSRFIQYMHNSMDAMTTMCIFSINSATKTVAAYHHFNYGGNMIYPNKTVTQILFRRP